jgi:hypothetical protein
MPSKKKQKNKKRRLEDIAPLYSEDIGTEGIKKSTGAVEQSSISNLPLAEDEEHRRRERKVRSDSWSHHTFFVSKVIVSNYYLMLSTPL